MYRILIFCVLMVLTFHIRSQEIKVKIDPKVQQFTLEMKNELISELRKSKYDTLFVFEKFITDVCVTQDEYTIFIGVKSNNRTDDISYSIDKIKSNVSERNETELEKLFQTYSDFIFELMKKGEWKPDLKIKSKTKFQEFEFLFIEHYPAMSIAEVLKFIDK